MNFIKYPSIGPFRDVVRTVNHTAAYMGQDEDGNAIMDWTAEKPTLTFTGTVKLHGTNAGVTYDPVTQEIQAQSRTRNISVDKDNAGFAFFVESNKEIFKQVFNAIICCIPYESKEVTLFGEWCGGNIQKGVALNSLEKMFVVFELKVGDTWFDLYGIDFPDPIKNIYDFKTYNISIDFNRPDISVDTLVDITQDVEKECPVCKELGVSGIGEGVVWRTKYKDQILRFKVKGEKHSTTKVKKLARVDTEKLKSIQEFVDYALTENRLNQGIEQVFISESKEPTLKEVSLFLKWVKDDIIKEELDTISDSNLEFKDVVGEISKKAVSWFKAKYVM